MNIKVKVRLNSNNSKLEKSDIPEFDFIAYLKSKPEANKANLELLRLISKHYNIEYKDLKLLKGQHQKAKIIRIDNE